MATLLQTYGHELEVAYDGATVRDGESEQPDLILLDLGSPDIDGYAVARALRALPWRKPPLLIAVTGWGSPPIASARSTRASTTISPCRSTIVPSARDEASRS